MSIDQELMNWIEQNIEIIKWMKLASEEMPYGQVVLNYHNGELDHCDICPRQRKKGLPKTVSSL